jgi:hypothetical protein
MLTNNGQLQGAAGDFEKQEVTLEIGIMLQHQSKSGVIAARSQIDAIPILDSAWMRAETEEI